MEDLKEKVAKKVEELKETVEKNLELAKEEMEEIEETVHYVQNG